MNNDFFNFCIQQPKAGQRQLDKPTFYRDFILDPQLNGPATFGTQLPSMTRIGPDITFTRTSSATFINQEGNIQIVDNNVPRFEYEGHRTNLLSASNDFGYLPGSIGTSGIVWGGGAQLAGDNFVKALTGKDIAKNAIGPDGVANSAWTINISALSGSVANYGVISQFPQPQTLVRGQTCTWSVWAKVTDINSMFLGGTSNGGPGITPTLSTQWKRYTFTGTHFDDRNTGWSIYMFPGSLPLSAQLFLYGAQLEYGTTATPYISTGTRPVTVSRPKGLLIEEQRANFVGQQNLFSWSRGGYVDLSAGSGIAGLSSFIINDTSYVAYDNVYYNFSTALLSATTYCFSCYVKKNPNFNNTYPVLRVYSPDNNVPYAGINFNQATGQAAIQPSYTLTSAVSVQDYNTYYRASFTFNTQSTAVPTQVEIIPSHGYGFGPTLSGTSIEVAGIQVEQGTFPTSYIPTVGSQATRAADNAVVDGNNFVNIYNNKEGTIYSEFSRYGIKPITGDSNSGNQAVPLSLRNTNNFNNAISFESGIADPTQQRLNVNNNISGTITFNNREGTVYSLAGSYKDIRTFAQNGIIVGGGSGSTPPGTGINKMSIGSNIAGAVLGQYLNGHIRKVGYWPKRLSNTTLRALTLSSLALGKYFAEDASLYTGTGPGVEVTRTSSATYFASGGKLTTAFYNRPRFDYDPVTNVCKGLLIEEQRTNLFTRSQQINLWSDIDAPLSAIGYTTAPDGTNTAFTFERQLGNVLGTKGNAHTTTPPFISQGTYTWSIFVKKHNYQGVRVGFIVGKYPFWAAWTTQINLDNGQIFQRSASYPYQNQSAPNTPKILVNSVPLTANGLDDCFNVQVTPYSNGWYRIAGTSSWLWNDSNYVVVTVGPGMSAETQTWFSPPGPAGLTVWGAQLEEGSFPTSYIPTTNAQVTRTADTVQINSTNWQRIYNPEQGTFYTKVLPLSGSQAAAVIDVGDTYNSIHGIWKSGPGGDGSSGTSWNAFSYSDFLSANAQLTPLTANFVSTAGVANSGSGIAYTYGFNNFNASVNGSLSTIITQSTAVSAIPVMTGFNHLNGHVQTLEYYPIQLTNTQLTALTIQ